MSSFVTSASKYFSKGNIPKNVYNSYKTRKNALQKLNVLTNQELLEKAELGELDPKKLYKNEYHHIIEIGKYNKIRQQELHNLVRKVRNRTQRAINRKLAPEKEELKNQQKGMYMANLALRAAAQAEEKRKSNEMVKGLENRLSALRGLSPKTRKSKKQRKTRKH